MLQIKIIGATPKAGKPLCITCKNATVVKGQNCEEIIFCGRVFGETKYAGVVPFKISECGEYHPSNQPSLYEMEEMAWIVKARKRGAVGFEPDTSEMEILVTPPKKDGDTPE